MGKIALVSELHEYVAKKNGHMIRGKYYGQSQRSEPFSAL